MPNINIFIVSVTALLGLITSTFGIQNAMAITFIISLLINLRSWKLLFTTKTFHHLRLIGLIWFSSSILGLLALNYDDTSLFLYLKSTYYCLAALSYFLTGFCLAHEASSPHNFLLSIAVGIAPVVIIPQLFSIIKHTHFLLAGQTEIFRTFSINSTFPLLCAIFFSLLKLSYHKTSKRVFLILGLITFGLSLISFTRTIYIGLAVLLLTLVSRSKKIISFFFLLAIALGFLPFIEFFLNSPLPELSFGSKNSTLYRFSNSISEVQVTRPPKAYKNHISRNRGGEAFLGFKKYLSYSLPEQILGRGFGAYVDPESFAKREGLYTTESKAKYAKGPESLTVVHNGVITILLSSGLIGLILYYSQFLVLLLYFKKISSSCTAKQSADFSLILSIGIGICLYWVLITPFIHGFFGPPVAFLIHHICLGASLQLVSKRSALLPQSPPLQNN